MSSTNDAQMGAIEVKTSFFFLAFLLYFFPAKASIDGSAEIAHGWGVKVYPIPAGRHAVRVWCPYMFMAHMGDATIEVDVAPGQVTAVEWKCPWLVFLTGSWVQRGARALTQQDLHGGLPAAAPQSAPAVQPQPVQQAAATAAGWHPDPQGQAALRYWDGQQWTAHVSDNQPAG